MEAIKLLDKTIYYLNGRFKALIVVYLVKKSIKFPNGVKLKCILLDLQTQKPKLLLDNHEPFGYHLHTKLPYDKTYRELINSSHYTEAISYFQDEVMKVIQNEN